MRPVPRAKLLASKLLVASSLAAAATLTIVVVALGVGSITFGWHDVLTPFLTTVPSSDALLRLALAAAYVWWTLGAVLAFAFFLSTLTDSPAGAIGGAFGLSVVSQILDGISSLHAIHPGLPTHYWSAWSTLFTPGVGSGFMVKGMIVAATWICVFVALAFWNFRRKDILS
jgi:ABC-2 type transport system permease protein